MVVPAPLDFSELRSARTALIDFTLRHELSIRHFRHESAAWFYLTDDEQSQRVKDQRAEPGCTQTLGRRERDDARGNEAKEDEPRIRHLTTTASCIESLYDLPERDDDRERDVRDKDLQELVDRFAVGALSREARAWESEDAAHVYCKVRALPAILDHASETVLNAHLKKIEELTTYAWDRVAVESRHHGIFEYSPPDDNTNASRPNEYPPNTFLTFWGMRVLESFQARWPSSGFVDPLRRQRETALLWSERTLGAQVALHASQSDRADPQQLAWAISTMIRFGDRAEVSTSQSADFIRAGLQALFDQQRPSGNFPRGEPLFHYPAAGNAYCYTLETFAELLHLALEEDRGAVLRDLLRPYGSRLLDLWRWARDTAQEIGTKDKPAVGWCSAHHPHRTSPESWATAAGFHSLQALRALIAVWAADSARLRLGVRKPRESARELAAQSLANRADSWDPRHKLEEEKENVGTLIGSLFLNPILAREGIVGPFRLMPKKLDPDVALIATDQARSAILFGPPGTGKTTVVELLAGAIGWDFVEILPSAFLAEGIDDVPKQADIIFQAVMELDRCVVLFDEADELIRDRTQESDPFGRFLTTSMLPKLAKLWDQRRVLFFINTNWIDRADPAIKRSQRFDSAIFFLPPAFTRKKDFLKGVLTDECEAELTRMSVEKALHETNNDPLGWFALIRYDLLDQLRASLSSYEGGARMTDLKKELGRMGEELSKTDWMPAPPKAGKQSKSAFELYKELAGSQRRDFGRLRYIRIDGKVPSLPPLYTGVPCEGKATFVAIPPGTTVPPLTMRAEGWSASRSEILWYSIDRPGTPAERADAAEESQEPPGSPSAVEAI